MTAATLASTPGLPGDVVDRLEALPQAERQRALRLLEVAERCCGGDVSVLVAIVEAVGAA